MMSARALLVLLAGLALASAFPTNHTLNFDKLDAPLPTISSGYIYVVPYQQAGSAFQCLNCNPVHANVSLVWDNSTFLTIFISSSIGQACGISAQKYPISQVAYKGNYYFTGYLSTGAQSQTFVCFYLDAAGNFVINVGGNGQCPATSASPSCQTVSGYIVQTWVASLAQSAIPFGVAGGAIAVKPYSNTPYPTCSNCLEPVSAGVSIQFYPATRQASIYVHGASNQQGCGVADQYYVVNNLLPNDPRYFPGYYSGSVVIGSANVPVCFYYAEPYFTIMLDGIGTCPQKVVSAQCLQTSVSTVAQIWAGMAFNQTGKTPLPQGLFNGQVQYTPYDATFQCFKQCSAVNVASSLSFSSDKLYISAAAGSTPQGCTMPSQVYPVQHIVSTSTPGYYAGILTIPMGTGKSFDIAACFSFNSLKQFSLQLRKGFFECASIYPPSSTCGYMSGTFV